MAGLAFAARHPDRVRTLVAHEPPVADLLPDAPYVRAAVDDIEDAYPTAGSGAAWRKFLSLVVLDGPLTAEGVPAATWSPPGQPDQDGDDAGQAPPAPTEKQQADDELFFLRLLKPFTRYQPEVDTLRSGGPRVVIGVGTSSHAEVAVRSALALAERLGTAPAPFPGDHGGFMADPTAFADALREVLSRSFEPAGH